MTAWIWLGLAGLLEIAWALGLKYTEGFTRPLPTLLTLTGAWASFYLLSLALKQIPIGTAYAIWTGIGAVGVAVLGMLLFREPVTVMRIVFLMMIVTGIIGLKLVTPTPH
jgi:quaternary ammonium compound-resistance protein SugE